VSSLIPGHLLCLMMKVYVWHAVIVKKSRALTGMRDKDSFDCIVGVSGGKDSHFQALYVKERLGLKALLVNLAPDVITEVGRHNLDNLIQQGFDLISFRLDPKVWRAVTRRAFSEYGNPVKPSEYPLFAVSYQTVLGFGIPLVVQGENPAMTLGVLGDLGFRKGLNSKTCCFTNSLIKMN
jgi:hypothetical protein